MKKSQPNKSFIIYDQATGEIAQVIDVPADEVEQNLTPGQAYRPLPEGAEIDPASQRIDSNGGIMSFDPPVDHDRLLREARAERNRRLSQCDWTQALDSPLSEPDRAAWAAYRQQLRDLMNTITDAQNVQWPTPPSRG